MPLCGPAVPSTLFTSRTAGSYISSQMMPTSASESMTGMKNRLWKTRLPRIWRSSRTANSRPSGVATTARNTSQTMLCRTAGQNAG